MAALLEMLLGPAGALLAGAATLAGAWLLGRRQGKQAAAAKQLRERQRAKDAAEDVSRTVAAGAPRANRERLRDRWSR